HVDLKERRRTSRYIVRRRWFLYRRVVAQPHDLATRPGREARKVVRVSKEAREGGNHSHDTKGARQLRVDDDCSASQQVGFDRRKVRSAASDTDPHVRLFERYAPMVADGRRAYSDLTTIKLPQHTDRILQRGFRLGAQHQTGVSGLQLDVLRVLQYLLGMPRKLQLEWLIAVGADALEGILRSHAVDVTAARECRRAHVRPGGCWDVWSGCHDSVLRWLLKRLRLSLRRPWEAPKEPSGTIKASQATSCRTRLATLPSNARCTRPPPRVPITSRSGRYSSTARQMAGTGGSSAMATS